MPDLSSAPLPVSLPEPSLIVMSYVHVDDDDHGSPVTLTVPANVPPLSFTVNSLVLPFTSVHVVTMSLSCTTSSTMTPSAGFSVRRTCDVFGGPYGVLPSGDVTVIAPEKKETVVD